MLKAPSLTAETVFQRAVDIRDACHGGAMSTLDAVNSVLAQAHTHDAWRREAWRLTRRVVHADYRGHAAGAYNWLLRHLVGPFFEWRLRFLDWRERHLLARAEKAGDACKAAWLVAHYRNERGRLSRHWSYLQARAA